VPVIELLKEYFQISPRDDARRRREKITGRVLTLDRALEDTLPYLLALVSPGEEGPALQEMEPQIRSRRLREAVRKVLLRESLNQPVLLLFEDLQWVDSETQAFLDLLSDSLATARVLLLVNYRPGYHHGWGNHAYYARIRLAPFGQEAAQAMLTDLLGESAAMQPLRRFVLEKAEGNPLFIEEIVRALLDQGVLAMNGGVRTLLKPFAEVQLPPTIHGILAARIDRLGTEEKDLLQTAAVIGKQFPVRLLERTAGQPEETLFALLARLRSGEFVYEQVAFPESAYAFKHALTQDVAYNSLLLEQRKRLHERTARAIEEDCCREESTKTLEEQCGELAYHYSRSGNITKAVDYLERAGEQAISRAARAEALQHFAHALELVRMLPDSAERKLEELRLLAACGGVRITMEGYRHPEVERIFTQVRELAQQGEDTPQLLPVLMTLSRFALIRGEYQDALHLGEWFARLARSTQDEAALLPAHFVLGYSEFRVGRFSVARRHLDQGLALRNAWQRPPNLLDRFLYRSAASGQDPRVGCLSWSGWVLWHLGYPDQALVRSQEAIALARELALPASEAAARYFATAVHRFRRESAAVLEGATAVIAIAEERESPHWLASGSFLRGWALAELGQWDEGSAQIRRGIEGWQALGNDHLGQPNLLLAETYGKAGRVEEGLRLLASIIPLIEQSAERWWEAERYRVEGELVLLQSKTLGPQSASSRASSPDAQAQTKAEACFLKAIDVARQQQAKSLELRATTSLARLWRLQNKQKHARQLLSEVYGWFTEGFDTKDLQEAKALLAELA
jgi:predicted ATPase